ncbi:hypothetical protein [Agromyces marinus]
MANPTVQSAYLGTAA